MEDTKKLLFLVFPLLMILCRVGESIVLCHKGTNYTTRKTQFQTNLVSVFSLINAAASTTHFQTTRIGNSSSDNAYAAFTCRYDLPLPTCHDCIRNATSDLEAFCSNYWEASSLYRHCAVQYANHSIFSQDLGKFDHGWGCDYPKFDDPSLKNTVIKTISDLIVNVTLATSSLTNGSNYYFATAEEPYMVYQKVHGLVQCSPEFTTSRCRDCLRDALNNLVDWCNGTLGGVWFGVDCSVTYSLYSFGNNDTAGYSTSSLAPSQLPKANSSPGLGPGVSNILSSTQYSGKILSLAQFGLAYFLWRF